MHNKYIITYECHDNAPRMWKVVQLIREIFWLLPVLVPLLPVVSHFSLVSTWKRSHFSFWFQSSGSPARWLPHIYRALDLLVRGYRVLLSHFEHIRESRVGTAEVQGRATFISKKLKDYNFLYVLFVLDILKVLNVLTAGKP